MKLKKIKQILDGLTEKQLEQEAFIVHIDFYDKINEFKEAHENFYYDYENPEYLLIESELKKMNIDKSECDLEIKEGDWYFLI